MKQIPLTQGQFAMVDDSDYDWLMQWKWTYAKNRKQEWAYRQGSIKFGKRRETIFMHRFIIDAPKQFEVDHEDFNGLNNQRNNLRLATRNQNQQHKRLQSNNTSGFKGVSFYKRIQRFVPEIRVDGRKLKLGHFTTAIEAAKVRDIAALKYHGEFAVLNFPMEIPPAILESNPNED